MFTPTSVDTGLTLGCNWHLKSTRDEERCCPGEGQVRRCQRGKEPSGKFNRLSSMSRGLLAVSTTTTNLLILSALRASAVYV